MNRIGPGVAAKVTIGDETGNDMTLEPDGSIPVTMQDQHTPAIISPLFRTLATTTLSDPFPVEATEIFVTSGTGIVVGSHLVLTDPTSGAFHICDATAVDGLVIGIDTPLAFPFTAGSNIEVGTHNIGLANGTPGSPVLYHARVSTGAPISFDVTRVMFLAETTGVGDLSQFGDLTALANGIVLRKNNGDGTFQSIFNAKSNGDMKGMMFDFDILSATNPQQGQNGFAGRLTFAGQNKMGVTIRLEPGTDLELLVQDNLTGLETFRIIAEGSVVQD